MWTESNDADGGFRAIRPVNDDDSNLDAIFDDGRRVDGGVLIATWDWKEGQNQKWKIDPSKCMLPIFLHSFGCDPIYLFLCPSIS